MKPNLFKKTRFSSSFLFVKLNLSLAVIPIGLISCGEEIDADFANPQDVISTYELSYYEINNRTEACATFIISNDGFFEADDELAFNKDNHVSFNELCLEQDSFGPNPYCRDFGNLITEGVFRLDFQGIYINEVSLPPAIDFNRDDTIIRGQNFEFIWEGAPSSVNEEISLTITGRRGNTVSESFEGQSDLTSIPISEAVTSRLFSGAAEVVISRTIETESLDAPSEGHIITKYESVASINVQ